MNVAEKLVTIAENQQKVFEAGGLAYSSKGNVSGEVVSITDISPIEHNLGVKLSSKNLIPYPYENTTKVMNGITFTDNGDGSITIKGKKEDTNASSYFILCRGIDFGDTAFGGGSDWSKTSHTNGTYTIGKGMFYNSNGKVLSVNIPSNVEVNETLYPMLEKGIKATAYTPYIEDISNVKLKRYGTDEADDLQEYTSNADGTVEGVKSIYPTTTLMTDTSGVLIEAEYYQDGKKVKENLTNVILGLGGILND